MLIRIVYLLVRRILGLAVLALCEDMAKDAEQRVEEALGHLDDTIREIRHTAFTTPDQSPPRPSPREGAGPAWL